MSPSQEFLHNPAGDEFPSHVIGTHRGNLPGPALVVIGGIHGNEPSGVRAAQRVIAALEREKPPMRGSLHCFAGNLGALQTGERFLEEDLNRIWTEELLAETGTADSSEARERARLHAELKAVVDTQQDAGEIYFMDLHTSSAEGVPFMCIGDTLRNRRFARGFPTPVILGLEEQIDGALLEFLNNRGLVTLGFEGGRHDDPAAVNAHEAAIWTGLGSAGMLPRGWPRVAEARRQLERARGGLPRILEVRYRHPVGEGFAMRPGFRNFQLVAKNEVIADDLQGPVRSFRIARVLLPLYQGLGDDGFFLGHGVKGFWLHLSNWMRRLRVDRVAHLLPGVRRHPELSDVLLVNRHVARWFTVQLFHLLGFRKRRLEGETWAFRRRQHDLKRPDRLDLD